MSKLFELEFYLDNIRTLGIIAILVGAGTWIMEFTDLVYVCPFCRAQRTVILILGIFMTLPNTKHFILRYITCILSGYALVVASNQHFRGWVSIQRGERGLITENWWIDSWTLSFFAICIITAQVWLIFLNKNK